MSRSALTSKFERLYNGNKIKQLKITGSQQTLYNIIYFLLAFEKKNICKSKNFVSMFSLKN